MHPFQEGFLEPSPYDADGGELIGCDPREIDREKLVSLGHPQSPIKAIRAKCLDCSGGSQSEARKCTATGCPLWPLRMGRNVFHGKASTPGKVAKSDG